MSYLAVVPVAQLVKSIAFPIMGCLVQHCLDANNEHLHHLSRYRYISHKESKSF